MLRKRMTKAALAVFAVVVFVLSVFPVYWMLNTAFTPNGLTRQQTPSFFPTNFTLENFETVLFDEQQTPFIPALLNSLSVTLVTVTFALAFAFLSAVALARFQFIGRKTFLVLILMKACCLVQPSTIAASSSSCGTPATKPRSIQMVNGSTVAM